MNENIAVKLFETQEEKERQKSNNIMLIILLSGVGVMIMIVAALFLFDPTTPINFVETCGTLDINDISLNKYIPQDDGTLVCIFDNNLEPYISTGENEKSTNPDYKVCYKLFALNDNNEYEASGQTC